MQDKKVMVFVNASTNAVWAAQLGTTPKKVWTATFLRWNSTSHTALESSRSRTLEYAVSAGLAIDKKITALLIFCEKLRKISLDWALWCASGGIDNFSSSQLHVPYVKGKSMESCRLAELKYAIFSRTGRQTKKLLRSKLFLTTIFKHGLLEWSTFLFQYSFITRTTFESSRLGELKSAISAGSM